MQQLPKELQNNEFWDFIVQNYEQGAQSSAHNLRVAIVHQYWNGRQLTPQEQLMLRIKYGV